MITIETDNNLVTFINMFTVDAANQARLIDLLTAVTSQVICHAKGFVSASLHSSKDGTKVTMYAQWRSTEDYEEMRRAPDPIPFFQEILTFAKFDPGMYVVVKTFEPTSF